MTIISRRGRATRRKIEVVDRSDAKTEVFIYHSSGAAAPLTPEEHEQIRKVFDQIRKQLESIGSIDLSTSNA